MKYITRALLILFGLMMILFFVINRYIFIFTAADVDMALETVFYGFDVNAGQFNYYDFFIPLVITVIILSFTKWYKYALHISMIVIVATFILNYDYALYGVGQYNSFQVHYFTASISTSIIQSDGLMTTTLYGTYINCGLIFAGFITSVLLIERLIVKKKLK